MAFGPQGPFHHSLDTFVTATPAPTPNDNGYLAPHPKQINAGDAKFGPRKGKAGQISSDTFTE